MLQCRKAKDFEERYLRKGFTESITVFRILDSRREKFAVSKPYLTKIKVVNVITAPEIEMLVILKEDKYTEYKKSKKKPSDFCTADLRYKGVKSEDFIEDDFRDVDSLVAAILEYKRVSNIQRGEYTLADLVK